MNTCVAAGLRRWTPSRDDRGFTLVELLVAMTLLGILGAVMVKSFLATTDGVQVAEARNRSLAEITAAVDRMTAVLQSGRQSSTSTTVALFSPGATLRTGDPPTAYQAANSGVEATFTAELGNPRGVSVVHWFVDSQNRLIEEVTAPDIGLASSNSLTYTTNAPTRRVLAVNVAVPVTGQHAIFTWYAAGSAVPLNAADPAFPLTDAKRQAAAGVEIRITAGATGKISVVSTARNFVPFPHYLASLPDGPRWTSTPTSALPDPTTVCRTCGGLPTVRVALGRDAPPLEMA